MLKTCTVCKTPKPLVDFYKNPGTDDGRGSQCRECDTRQVKERRKAKKLQLVLVKGGKCENEKCGYCANLAALQFHHENGKKEMELNRLGVSIERLLVEIKKCRLLCANCHAEVHHPDMALT